jgi:enoyl-CoA hydratase/carnithine racemase
VLPLAEALERLQSPLALEAFSPLTGAPLLLVNVASYLAPERATQSAFAAARATLASLPCPSVALHAERAHPAADELIDRFDLVLSSDTELEPVRTAVERSPLAALALVQLLRHGAKLDIEGALMAESLVYSTLQSGPEFARWLAERSPPARWARPSGPAVLVERSGSRLALTLNRPAKRNAFSAEMRDALAEALQLVLADPSLEEVVLRGAGPAFCSGGDLDEFGTLPDPATAHAIRSTRNAARLLAACGNRVRAEIHGACIGAGIELPAFTGHVVAARDAFVQLPEVAMGLVPGAGGTASLPRRIGRQRTAWLALTGARLDAETALRWGLVDELR